MPELWEILCCPECHGGLQRRDDVLTCGICGVVGCVRGDQYDFLHFNAGAAGDSAPRRHGRVSRAGRGLPLFPRVVELIEMVSKNGRILDCGGGERTLADARYVNAGFAPSEFCDVIADPLKLPFQTESFDLVVSQAVLQHLKEPFQAARELVRVTKSRGALWAGMSFLQPIHSAPHHYFNATPWGIRELFHELPDAQVGWFGELSHTVDWFLQASGASEQMPRAEYEELVERLKRADRYVSWEGLRSIASGVSLEARKAETGVDAAGRIAALLAAGGAEDLERVFALIPLLPAAEAGMEDDAARATHDAAFAAEATGDFQRCAAWFERVLEYDVNDAGIHAGAWFRLGRNLERLSRWRQARKAYENALATASGSIHLTGHARHRLATLAYEAEDYEEAYAHFHVLMTARPDDLEEAEVLLDCARSARFAGRAPEAEDLLGSVCAIDSQGFRAAEAQFVLAEIYEHSGRIDAARSCYREIISNPHVELAMKATAEGRLQLLK